MFQALYSFKSGVINLILLFRGREFRLTEYTLAFGWHWWDREKVKGYLWKFKIDSTVIAPLVNKIFNRRYRLWDIDFIFVDSRRVGVEIVRHNLSVKFVNGRSSSSTRSRWKRRPCGLYVKRLIRDFLIRIIKRLYRRFCRFNPSLLLRRRPFMFHVLPFLPWVEY